jgi:hypothetical protein
MRFMSQQRSPRGAEMPPRTAGSDITCARDVTGSAWARVRDHLRHLRNALQDEIRNYPTPIAGCDQQFNYLLQKRQQLIEETSRIDAALASDDMLLASNIVHASAHIDEGVKAGLIGNGVDLA